MSQFREILEKAISNIKDVNGPKNVGAALLDYADELVSKRQGLSMRGVDGAPDWYKYETILWDICRDLIDPIFKDRKWRGWNDLIEAILKLCQNKKYGKGRQPFVLLLGKIGSIDCICTLRDLIDDDEVSIHSIDSLTKMEDLSSYTKIKLIAEGKKATPQRSYARKYVKRIEGKRSPE